MGRWLPTSSPSLAKSADRIDGAMRKLSVVSFAFHAMRRPPSARAAEDFARDAVWKANVIETNRAQKSAFKLSIILQLDSVD